MAHPSPSARSWVSHDATSTVSRGSLTVRYWFAFALTPTGTARCRLPFLGSTVAAPLLRFLSAAGLLQRLVQLALALLLDQVVQHCPLRVRLLLEDAAIHLESAFHSG